VAFLHRWLRSQQRGSNFFERHGSPQAGPLLWLLPVFIRALGIPFGLPSKPFGLNLGRHSKCKPLCLYSLPEPHDSVRRPLAGLKSRNLRDTDAYTENIFCGQTFLIFFVFYFFGK